MKNIPNKIYLQLGDCECDDFDEHHRNAEEVTWCRDKIFPTDIEYVLPVLADTTLRARLEALVGELSKTRETMRDKGYLHEAGIYAQLLRQLREILGGDNSGIDKIDNPPHTSGR